MAWVHKDEAGPATDAIYERIAVSGAHVPALWRLEVANVLRTGLRRKRIDLADRDAALDMLSRLHITVHDHEDRAWTTVLSLSDRLNLTPYDAVYLDLAIRLGLPLATTDGALADAARAEGVSVLP